MEEGELLLKVEGLSKKFCKNLKTSLWYGVQDLMSGIIGKDQVRELRPKEFWAVKDISFELRRGECLGLIGHNGAGKSTLLKILNGLINPDDGKVTIKGRVGALIELGAGFNPILTGRENVYNNGAVLGFTRKEINTKLQIIIDFAELEEFIDMPVQHYSSGMKVRLGFAIAAQMEPDVLIIDEVLAVGDLGFVLKCFKTIDTILPRTAVIFVSHSMPMISRICTQIILLQHGESTFQGMDIGKAIDLYYKNFTENSTNVIFDDGSFEMLKAEVLNIKVANGELPSLEWGKSLNLYFKFKMNYGLDVPIFIIVIYDKEQREVAYLDYTNQSEIFSNDNIIEFKVIINELQLSKGIYTFDVSVNKKESREPYLRIRNVFSIQVLHELEIFPPFLISTSFESINTQTN